MRDEWKLKIQYQVEHMGFALYVYRKLPDGKREFMTGRGTVETVALAESPDKPMWLAIFESTEQLRQLIEEAEKQGVSAPTTDRITGELNATKHHLSDLRQLLKLKDKEPRE